MSIEDGIKLGDMVKVTIHGYAGDACYGTTESGQPSQKVLRLDYGRGESFYLCCDQPGVTVARIS